MNGRMSPDPTASSANGRIERVRAAAREMLHGARGSHAWDHTLRVYRLCQRIGPPEEADMEVLCIAALLHDVGRGHQDASNGAVCHAVQGAVLAAPLVRSLSLSPERTENVLHCIRSHRFRSNRQPESIEAKVLFDADKLDAIGAVGIARAYLFAGEVGARLHNPGNRIENTRSYSREDTGYREYRRKLCRIRERILTTTGRRLADDRHAFMESFFNRFIEEYEGKR